MWHRFSQSNRLPRVLGSSLRGLGLLILFSQIAACQSLKSPLDGAIKAATDLEARINLNLEAGDRFLNDDKSSAAKRYYERAVTEGVKLGNHPSYASALFKLANLQENKTTARSLYQSALDIYEKLYGDQNLNSAQVFEAIVWTYDYAGDDNQIAVDIIQKAITIRKLHNDTETLPSSLRTLSWLYEVKKDFKNAEKSYRDALQIDLKNLGFEDIRVVLSMENLAQFFIDIEDYSKAEGVLWDKIKRHKRTRYTDYYNLGRSESMLAWVYLKRDNIKNAERYFLSAFESIKKSMKVEPNQSDIPTYALPALLDLVHFYTETEQFEKALPYYQQAQKLLTETGDGTLADHAQFIENEILSGNGVSYPWSADAQIDGIRLMLEYIQNQQ